jgi:hypothetical protein
MALLPLESKPHKGGGVFHGDWVLKTIFLSNDAISTQEVNLISTK